MVVVLAHRLDEDVERPERACRWKPSCMGSVTATICIPPAPVSRCTRCRTAASLRPTIRPISEYERRPSSCSISTMVLEIASRVWSFFDGAMV